MDWLGTYTFDSLASTDKMIKDTHQTNIEQMSQLDLEESFERHKRRIKKLYAMGEEQQQMIQQILKHITGKKDDEEEMNVKTTPSYPATIIEEM